MVAPVPTIAQTPAPPPLSAPPPAAVQQTPTEGDDIVIVARRRRCDLGIADRIMSDKEFRARAKEWAAGQLVRIRVPRGSSYMCQANIMFRLKRYGVVRAVFVDE